MPMSGRGAQGLPMRLSLWLVEGNRWKGPSGPAFARLVRGRLAGVPGLEVDVRPVSERGSPPGAYLVDVGWRGGDGVLCEVVDWVDGVRIMDPHGEGVTVDIGLRYLQARAAEVSSKHAWKFAQGDA